MMMMKTISDLLPQQWAYWANRCFDSCLATL